MSNALEQDRRGSCRGNCKTLEQGNPWPGNAVARELFFRLGTHLTFAGVVHDREKLGGIPKSSSLVGFRHLFFTL